MHVTRKLYTITTKVYSKNLKELDSINFDIKKELFVDFEEACLEAKSIFDEKLEQLHIKEDAFKEEFPDNGVFKAIEFCKEDIPFKRIIIVNVAFLTLEEESESESTI